MKKFKEGDRVVFIGDDAKRKGQVAIVKGFSANWYAIEFTNPGLGVHSCGGLCKKGYGWYTEEQRLVSEEDFSKTLTDKVTDISHHYESEHQPIETMQANMTNDEFIGFLKGNIIKYTCRCGKKDDVYKEVVKIKRYAKWLCEAVEGRTIDPRRND